MKALTISQPFASLIASGEKWVENRTWRTDHRGPLAIHAGKGTQYLTKTDLAQYPHGCVIAVVDLVACLPLASLRQHGGSAVLDMLGLTPASVLAHEHTAGPWCWILRNVRPVACVPWIGCQGLFEITDVCRVCGCSEFDACLHEVAGPCSWAEPDLCSHCQAGLDCGSRDSRLVAEMEAAL